MNTDFNEKSSKVGQKILVCTNFLDSTINGICHFPRFLLRYAAENEGHNVHIVTYDVPESRENVTKIVFDYPRFLHPFTDFLVNIDYLKAVRQHLKTHEVDVVIFNTGVTGILTRLILPKKIKVLGLIHDDDSLKPSRKNALTYRKYIYGYIRRWLEKVMTRRLDAVLCCSDFIRDTVIKLLKANPKKILTLHQAIDIQAITYKNYNWTKGNQPIKVVFVKAAYIRGGLENLINALGLCTEYAFELTILGAREMGFEDIKKWATEHKNLKINLLGKQPPEIVSAALYAHHILCIPARAEGLGLANVEGLAHGISVIATNVGGIPEVMNNDRNGWIVPPDDVPLLANALRACIEAPSSVRAEKSQEARHYIEQHFDYPIMINRLFEIIKSI